MLNFAFPIINLRKIHHLIIFAKIFSKMFTKSFVTFVCFRKQFSRKMQKRIFPPSILLGIPQCTSFKTFRPQNVHAVCIGSVFLFPIVFISKKGANTRAENKFFSSHHLSECLDFVSSCYYPITGCTPPAEQNNIQKMVAEFTVLTFFIVIANKRIL